MPAIRKKEPAGSDSRNQLGCYSTSNGSQLWIKEHCQAYPVLAGREVYVATDDNRIACINAQSGATRWTSTAITAMESFCVVDYQGNSFYTTESGHQN